jgi:hypothetical protein
MINPSVFNIETSFEAKQDMRVGTGVEAGLFSQVFPISSRMTD